VNNDLLNPQEAGNTSAGAPHFTKSTTIGEQETFHAIEIACSFCTKQTQAYMSLSSSENTPENTKPIRRVKVHA
jgi:hypothetical protein